VLSLEIPALKGIALNLMQATVKNYNKEGNNCNKKYKLNSNNNINKKSYLI
jgi:hypothetical protein